VRRFIGSVAVVLAACAGCAPATGDAPERTAEADCPPSLPDRTLGEEDDGSGRPLVPTSPEPVRLTLCEYGLSVHVQPAPGTAALSTAPPRPTSWAGDDLAAAIAELDALPPYVDAGEKVCNAAMWPGYLLLVQHRDGTVTSLTVDRSCAVISDGTGAVRWGLPSVVTAR
jgi:hypothetical protein